MSNVAREEIVKLLEMLSREEKRLESGKLDRYVPHTKQLEFHQSKAKVRLMLGGNRCIREDQRIITKQGLVPIGDMRESHSEVLSYNQISNQFEWCLASPSFPKGKSQQYRVVHGGGQFVADSKHLMLSSSYDYRFVGDLSVGQEVLLCRQATNLGFFQKLSTLNDVHLNGKFLNSMDDYQVYSHLYGQRLQFLIMVCQLFFVLHSDAKASKLLGGLEVFERQGLQARQKLMHSHPYLRQNLLKNLDDFCRVLGRSDFAWASSIVTALAQQTCKGIQVFLQSLLRINQEMKAQQFAASKSSTVGQVVLISSSDPISISTIFSIEKLNKEEWYWDLTVSKNHNYVTEDGVIHHNSGKTTSNVIEAIWLSLGIHPFHSIPVPNRGKMYGDSFASVMETFVPKFEEWCPPEYFDSKKPFDHDQRGNVIGVNFRNGSRIVIGSYDQETRKAEGSNWQWVSFDEPPPRELYIANMRGLIDSGGIMWFSMTPLSQAYIKDDLWDPGISGEKPYIECFNMRSDENPHIDHNALNLFLAELTDAEREVRFEGKFAKLVGVVIDTYESRVHDIDAFELDENFVIYEGLDPHPMKPHCALWKAVSRDGIRYVVDELAFTGGLYDFGKELVAKRKELCAGGARVGGSVVDTIINTTEMANRIDMRAELVRGIRDAGGGVLPSSAFKKDQLNPGIEKIKDLYRVVDRGPVLGKGPMQYVFKRCLKYKYELTHYQWPETLTDVSKPKPIHDDFIACFEESVEVLTREGFKKFIDVKFSDDIATVNLSRDVLEYSKPIGITNYQYNGEMVQIDSRLKFKVTPNHKMVVSMAQYGNESDDFFIEAKNLKKSHCIKTTSGWVGEDIKTFILPGVISHTNRYKEDIELDAEDFFSFVGWFISEGNLAKPKWPGHGYEVSIAQTKPLMRDKISKLLSRMPFKYYIGKKKFSIQDKRLWLWLEKNVGKYQIDRVVPDIIKNASPKLINIFLESAIDGDGSRDKNCIGRDVYITTSKKLADEIQELLFKCGFNSTLFEKEPVDTYIRGRLVKASNCSLIYNVYRNISSRVRLSVKNKVKFYKTNYNGMVGCVTVPNRTVVVRNNGKIFVCGNCERYLESINPGYQSPGKSNFLVRNKTNDAYSRKIIERKDIWQGIR